MVPVSEEDAFGFVDVSGSWAERNISTLVQLGTGKEGESLARMKKSRPTGNPLSQVRTSTRTE
jgi:hypothetical protein